MILNMTGSPVQAMSTPGGRGRRSVRAELEDGRTLIATQREHPARAANEAGLLAALSEEGAPVPAVIGFDDGLLLQADAGRNRLSNALWQANPEQTLRLLRRAASALEICRSAMARRPDVLAQIPGLGARADWSENFVARAVFLSGDLRIPAPKMDAEAVARALTVTPAQLTRWDARSGNASVQADGSVIWYDWEIFGRRAGVEDLSFLLSDLYVRLPEDALEDLLAELAPEPARRDLCRRMAVFLAVERLAKIHQYLEAEGSWADAQDTLRYDRVGAVPELIDGLCSRMAALAASDEMVGDFARWFPAARDALINQAG